MNNTASTPNWRNKIRKQLLQMRRSLGLDEKHKLNNLIVQHLSLVVRDISHKTVAGFYPLDDEPDILALLEQLANAGNMTALPVATKDCPLQFYPWKPGEPLTRGFADICEPANQSHTVIPDIVIAPVVGFDHNGYRLGYGGGFYDRTLANLPETVISIGVGYDRSHLPTIHPQSHDKPLDYIITESQIMTFPNTKNRLKNES